MTPFSILLIVLGVFIIVFSRLNLSWNKLKKESYLLFSAGGLVMIIVGLFPQLSFAAASLFGIQRGSDFLLYLSVIVLFYLLIRQALKTEQLESKISRLVENVALANPEKQKQKAPSQDKKQEKNKKAS